MRSSSLTHTHTHTFSIYYIYIYTVLTIRIVYPTLLIADFHYAGVILKDRKKIELEEVDLLLHIEMALIIYFRI